MKSLASDRDTREVLERLESVRPDSQRRWGKMSAHQMICHLTDACRMALGEITVSDSTSLVQRTVVKWIALRAPMKWPPGILTRPEIDQQKSGTCPKDFETDLAEALRLTAALARRRQATWPSHPIFGPMTESEWLRWGYLHTDHHLRQFGA